MGIHAIPTDFYTGVADSFMETTGIVFSLSSLQQRILRELSRIASLRPTTCFIIRSGNIENNNP